MRRRDLLLGFGAATLLPGGVRSAQAQSTLRRIGVLAAGDESDAGAQERLASMLGGLKDLGWEEGKTLEIVKRWGSLDPEQLRRMAREVVASRPEVIFTATTPNTRAVLAETRTIPVVFSIVTEPISSGFVESLAHPGGNATGFTNFDFAIGGKWLQILREIAPDLARLHMLFNPETATYAELFMPALRAAAGSMSLATAPVRSEAEIEAAIAGVAAKPGGALLVLPDVFTANRVRPIVEAASRHRIIGIYPYRYFAEGGGLVAYGIDPLDVYRRSAGYVDRILKGDRPENLPVQNPSKFELVINLKTAKALGLTASPSLLAAADAVIE